MSSSSLPKQDGHLISRKDNMADLALDTSLKIVEGTEVVLEDIQDPGFPGTLHPDLILTPSLAGEVDFSASDYTIVRKSGQWIVMDRDTGGGGGAASIIHSRFAEVSSPAPPFDVGGNNDVGLATVIYTQGIASVTFRDLGSSTALDVVFSVPMPSAYYLPELKFKGPETSQNNDVKESTISGQTANGFSMQVERSQNSTQTFTSILVSAVDASEANAVWRNPDWGPYETYTEVLAETSRELFEGDSVQVTEYDAAFVPRGVLVIPTTGQEFYNLVYNGTIWEVVGSLPTVSNNAIAEGVADGTQYDTDLTLAGLVTPNGRHRLLWRGVNSGVQAPYIMSADGGTYTTDIQTIHSQDGSSNSYRALSVLSGATPLQIAGGDWNIGEFPTVFFIINIRDADYLYKVEMSRWNNFGADSVIPIKIEEISL